MMSAESRWLEQAALKLTRDRCLDIYWVEKCSQVTNIGVVWEDKPPLHGKHEEEVMESVEILHVWILKPALMLLDGLHWKEETL